ncbi:MAG: ATP-binding protein, partial [Nitrospinae bacterium]|nr:ATP-binding protein [Nitrospinota bacterium]
MESEKKRQTLQTLLTRNVFVIILFFIVVLSVTLPNLLNTFSLTIIKKEARIKAEILKASLIAVMQSSNGKQKEVRKIADLYKGNESFEFRIIRSKYVAHQFGNRKGEEPQNQDERDVLQGKVENHASIDGDTYHFVFPFISDERCQTCHLDLNNNPVALGTILGVSNITFDLTKQHKEAKKYILINLGIIILTLVCFAIILYIIFNNKFLKPMRMISSSIRDIGKGKILNLPEVDTVELDIVVEQVKTVSDKVFEKKRRQEERLKDVKKHLEFERKKLEEIGEFAFSKVKALGIEDEGEISDVIQKLRSAFEEVESKQAMLDVFTHVRKEYKEIVIGNAVDEVHQISLYLTEPMSESFGEIKVSSVELALVEAIENAMIHGNLEIPSSIKEESFDAFNKAVEEKKKQEPFASKKVRITSEYDQKQVTYTISDDGSGFNWKKHIEGMNEDNYLPHGRGLLI